MIELRNIEVCFNQNTKLQNRVLKDISLTIPEHQFVTVIGGNGAGKSTLMNVLSGDVRLSSGNVWIDGKEVSALSTEQRSHMVARVFQDPTVGTFAELTVEENMSIAAKRGESRGLRSCLNKERREYFKEALSELGMDLEKRLNDRAISLSGGQRQALGLVMATLKPSKILLLDEHTAALDPKVAKVIMTLTDKIIKKNQLTALMITHSMSQALDYGDRTIMMYHGEVVRDMIGESRVSLSPNDLVGFFDL
jgi:putative ABC transport system ATP-binding protein